MKKSTRPPRPRKPLVRRFENVQSPAKQGEQDHGTADPAAPHDDEHVDELSVLDGPGVEPTAADAAEGYDGGYDEGYDAGHADDYAEHSDDHEAYGEFDEHDSDDDGDGHDDHDGSFDESESVV